MKFVVIARQLVGQLKSIEKGRSWQQSRAHPGGTHCQSSHMSFVMGNVDSLRMETADVCAKHTVVI